VWRLDRLGRSLKHLIETVTRLEKKEIGFQSLQESINTTSSSGKLLFHFFACLPSSRGGLSKKEPGREMGRFMNKQMKKSEKKTNSRTRYEG